MFYIGIFIQLRVTMRQNRWQHISCSTQVYIIHYQNSLQ